jgi:hypothetical protein
MANKPIRFILKPLLKAPALLLLVWMVCTCVTPYTPELKGYESLLVVEGMITDESVPCEVKLSRSIQNEDLVPEKITDATVYVSDEAGVKTYLVNQGNGSYLTNPSEFRGIIGKTYTLHIITADSREYISDPAVMLPVPEIENIYYEKDAEVSGDQSEIQEGITIYIDTGPGSENSQYIRWEYEETWKFRLPDYKRYNYIHDSVILPIPDAKEYCWNAARSSLVSTGYIANGDDPIKKAPVCFIASAKSDRLTLQYSILIKQYSLSKEAYDFWNNLKQVNESGGTIFDKQPYPVISNITNINDPAEKVLGYFQVSASKQERKYITASELDELNLPSFKYGCKRYQVSPDDYPPPFGLPPMTWDELYEMFMTTGGLTFVEPIYDENKALEDLVFTETICSDCELTGSAEKPDWWIDLI